MVFVVNKDERNKQKEEDAELDNGRIGFNKDPDRHRSSANCDDWSGVKVRGYEQKSAQKLDYGVSGADGMGAMATFSAQEDPAKHRDIVESAYLSAAIRARRARFDDRLTAANAIYNDVKEASED